MTSKSSAPNFEHFGQSGNTHYPDLIRHISTDLSFPTAYLKAVAAIACSDGVLNVADFNALSAVASLMNDSALARVVLLEHVEHPVSWKTALVDLQKASFGIDQATAATAFEAVHELLSLQGTRSRELAKSFAYALRHEFRPNELMSFPTDDQTVWSKVSMSSVRMFKGRKYADLANLCVRATGDATLASAVLEFEQGGIKKEQLVHLMTTACARASKEISEFNRRIADIENSREVSAALLESAYVLQKQVHQRLAIAEARILFERESFAEDIEEYIHDAGNAFERDVVERLNTDKWKTTTVWEGIAKTAFGKELERRISRIISRREESLRLIQEDLRLFKEEMALSRSTILKRLHHSQFANLAPALRWGTRFMNGTETIANTTLAIGGISALGAGAAAYFLGAAVVLPVVAPVAPIIGGMLLVAGAFKWMMDPDARKSNEIGHHREIFEKAFRVQLDMASIELTKQLDATLQQFHEAAEGFVQPIVIEAQAANRLASLHLTIARKLNSHSQQALADMLAALPA